jgi:hypothetical protein
MSGSGNITNNKSLSFYDYGRSEFPCDYNSLARISDQMMERWMFNKLPPASRPYPNDANGVTKCCQKARCDVERSTATRTARAVIMPLVAGLAGMIGLLLPARADEHTLAWDYDPVALQRGMTNENARVWFRLYYTPDATIPLTNWLALPATTNTTMKVDVPRTWGFFALNASNYLGLVWCLNQTNVPAPVLSNYVIRIIKP